MDFLVERSNLRRTRFEEGPSRPLADGQVRLRIKKFAFTSNNVTYGAVGEMIGYWQFFPATDDWGRIPVWGIAAVDETRHPDLPEGERLYGYLPMSTELVIEPTAVTAHGLVDGAAHRAALPEVYNQYTRLAAEPGYDRADDDRRMLLQPLFLTAFLIDDFLADNDFFGARTVVLASASSKTAFSTASLLALRPGIEVVGLTSSPNRSFTEGLGCYHRVVAYDEIESLATGARVVFVDMAGNAEVLGRFHRHFGDNVVHSCQVGVTHWESRGDPGELPGAAPAFFFAPSQVAKRRGDWGAAGFVERSQRAWQNFLEQSQGWLEVVHGRGPEAVAKVYLDAVEGHLDPRQGHVLSLE